MTGALARCTALHGVARRCTALHGVARRCTALHGVARCTALAPSSGWNIMIDLGHSSAPGGILSEKLPEKCCGRCFHGRRETDRGTLKTVDVCKAGPPTPIAMAISTPAGPQIGTRMQWPVMQATD